MRLSLAVCMWLMVEQGRMSGQTGSQPDLIIAAIAREGGLKIVIRDTSEYRRAKVPVFDPWRDVLV
jgi:predicted nucleic acid-binding protein